VLTIVHTFNGTYADIVIQTNGQILLIDPRPRAVTDEAPPLRPILTAEDVVRRIATECAFVDERGSVGIRLKPAIAIVGEYGEQCRKEPPIRRRRPAALARARARQPALLLPVSGARTTPKPGRS
jgi:hypothetical protein